MGIDLSKQKNILIHDLPLPKKNPRAACYPLKVPDDVRLTVKPTGGAGDYETLLHEMGHAVHHALTETDHFEFKQLGDNTVTEAYASLLEELMDSPAWVKEFIGIPYAEMESYLKFRRFSKLYFARRYAAKLLYEKELHAGAKNPRELYRTLLSKAYGFSLDEKDAERYLSDVDDYYYVADYLRAWFLRAQMEKALVERYGERWFANPKAGEFLRSLWKYGQELNGEELAKKLGYERLDPAIYIESLLRK
jgi:oligoendopeptidase F